MKNKQIDYWSADSPITECYNCGSTNPVNEGFIHNGRQLCPYCYSKSLNRESGLYLPTLPDKTT